MGRNICFTYDNSCLDQPVTRRFEFGDWLVSKSEEIEDHLSENGAVLLRNFPISSAEDFSFALNLLKGQESFFKYDGGTSPRTSVTENVFTSTDMPFFSPIPFHSEMVYNSRFPKKLAFFCKKAPWWGGCTPISDNQGVYEELDLKLDLCQRTDSVIYYRRLKSLTIFRKWLGKIYPLVRTQTWQSLFQTTDPKVVENFYLNQGVDFEWQPDQSLLIKSALAWKTIRPGTSKKLWLNSVHFFQLHPRIWGRLATWLYRSYKKMKKEPLDQATWRDGRTFSKSDVDDILDAYEKNSFRFSWKKGDLLIVNNILLAHGRDPYLGPRKILAGLIGATSVNENLY